MYSLQLAYFTADVYRNLNEEKNNNHRSCCFLLCSYGASERERDFPLCCYCSFEWWQVVFSIFSSIDSSQWDYPISLSLSPVPFSLDQMRCACLFIRRQFPDMMQFPHFTFFSSMTSNACHWRESPANKHCDQRYSHNHRSRNSNIAAIRRHIDIGHIHWLRQRKDQKEYEIGAFFPLLHLDICQIARSKWKKSRCQLKTRLLFSRCVLRTSRKRKLRRHRRRRRRPRRRRSRGRWRERKRNRKERKIDWSVTLPIDISPYARV